MSSGYYNYRSSEGEVKPRPLPRPSKSCSEIPKPLARPSKHFSKIPELLAKPSKPLPIPSQYD